MGEKFAALPQGTKIAIFASSAGAGALLIGAFLFICCRMRRAGRKEGESYNALVEQQRQETYNEQMELRAKSLGTFNDASTPTTANFASPVLASEKSGYFGPDAGYAALPPRSPGFGGLQAPIEAPQRSMTASPLDRSMSPPVLVPVPAQMNYNGGYAQRHASPSVGMQSPTGYHPF